jgi:type I restriction enzyme S subunit
VTADWSRRTLAHVCQIRPPKSEARTRCGLDTPVSFVPMEDLGVGSKFVAASRVRPLSSVAGSYVYFADGDVLLPKISPCFENGKLGIARNLVNGVGFGSSEFIVLRPDMTVDAEWLYYFLSRAEMREEGSRITYGTVGQRRLPREFIADYLIPVPPISEQKRIVRILDEALDGIATVTASAERSLENARAVFQSELQGVFAEAWRIHPLI